MAEQERKLKEALKRADKDARQSSERIALPMSKRHIETWILNLNGDRVNETTDYRNSKDLDGKIKQAAETFFDWSRDSYPVPEHCVTSLYKGLKEIRRVD